MESRLVVKLKPGASFTGVTVMVKVFVARSTPPLTVPPSSATTTVTSVAPFAFAAGVNVSVPLAASAGCELNSAGLAAVTLTTLTVCVLSLTGPTLKVANAPTVCAAVSSSTTKLFVA